MTYSRIFKATRKCLESHQLKQQFMKEKSCNAQSANIRHLGKATLLLTGDLYIWDKSSNVQSVIFSLLGKAV